MHMKLQTDDKCRVAMYSVSQKNPPLGDLAFFHFFFTNG